MYEAHVTVVGRVATQVDFRMTATGVPRVRFRLASTVRRFDKQQGGWCDAYTSFYTVWAWRGLAHNVASSVAIGDPLLVTGQLRVEERERDGRPHVSAELTATAIGHDLSRGTSAFARASAARPEPARGDADEVAALNASAGRGVLTRGPAGPPFFETVPRTDPEGEAGRTEGRERAPDGPPGREAQAPSDASAGASAGTG